MIDPRFGLQPDRGDDEQLQSLISSGKKFSPVDAKILRMQFYDEHFGIRDYNTSVGEHPFSLMLMSEAEDYITDGAFHKACQDYVMYKVGEFFKVSFLEYMSLSPDRIRTIHDVCKKQIEENNAGVDDASKKIAKAQREVADAIKGNT